MLTYTSINHESTLNRLAAAMQKARNGAATIVYTSKGKALFSVVYRGGVYKFVTFKTAKFANKIVKKAMLSSDNPRFRALSCLVA